MMQVTASRTICLTVAVVCLSFPIFLQSSQAQAQAQEAPDWFLSPPSPTSKVGFVAGSGRTPRSAYVSALVSLARSDSATIRSRLVQTVREDLRKTDSGTKARVDEDVRQLVEASWETEVPGVRTVARVRGQTKHWTLFAIPRQQGLSENEIDSHLSLLRSRRHRAIRWRSVVPGWAQAKKGEPQKALIFASGVASLGAAAVFARTRSRRLSLRGTSATSGPQSRVYRRKAARWNRGFQVASAGLVALYIWNIVDAWTADSRDDPFFGPVDVRATGDSPGASVAINF